jgi:Na+/proline symporter
MIDGWLLAALAFAYVGALFAIAWAGDHAARFRPPRQGRPVIYALSIAVYCTSWTFFGSVGLAATTGYDFLPIYVGPILLFVFGGPLLLRIVRLAKSQNITSVADFMAARYGKSPAVAAIVTMVAVTGTLPYTALQLKAIAVSVGRARSAAFRCRRESSQILRSSSPWRWLLSPCFSEHATSTRPSTRTG